MATGSIESKGKVFEIAASASAELRRFEAAQDMGRLAAGMRHQAQEIERTIEKLGLEPLNAPEGFAFNVGVKKHEGRLTIQTFDGTNWSNDLAAGSAEYDVVVKRSGYGDDVNMDVTRLVYDPQDAQIWGYDDERSARVLVGGDVRVTTVELQPH